MDALFTLCWIALIIIYFITRYISQMHFVKQKQQIATAKKLPIWK